MAKLLGQDICTQDEFNSFKQKEFDVLHNAFHNLRHRVETDTVALAKAENDIRRLSTALRMLCGAVVVMAVTIIAQAFHLIR